MTRPVATISRPSILDAPLSVGALGKGYASLIERAQQYVTVNGRHQYSLLLEPGTERERWERVPSVTQVVGVLDKPALVHWAAKEQQSEDIETAWSLARAIRDGAHQLDSREAFEQNFRAVAGQEKAHRKKLAKAADLGTQVHALIEHWLLTQLGQAGEQPEASDAALYVYAGFEQWAKDVRLQPLLMERRVFSLSNMVGGCFDFFGYVEGRLEILDWKSSKGVWPEMRLQNVAYRQLAAEMGVPNVGGRIVRLPKGEDQGGIEVVPVDDDPDEVFRVFLALRAVHGWVNKKECA